ncbi:unnamed protein product [Didymodactylos carnosus]|uniref:Pre-mRNA-splicing factor SYF2 n=1 Tax=Didymodactylos carnosus TaxID=1234261 RepID=A0A813UN34_9BILA|nr:unnamed protein product [Didymodactylos carnosus]CAF0825673.1 unnamed protein product [Didymodactylos carnosus]CAF3542938.1 unnamed protein product [Didymodactylos carnosus]CAF3612428.1 unnamed protein product [Didymodactylos carnosus]
MLQINDEPTLNDVGNKHTDRLNRLKELHFRRNEARKLNHLEVIEEDHRKDLPTNYEKRCERVQKQDEQTKKKKDAANAGLDFDRVEMLEWTAEEVDRWEKKKRKRNPDVGFDNYEQCTARAHGKLTSQLKPDFEALKKQKEELGEDYYATTSTLIHGTHKPSESAINRMTEDLEKQVLKRSKYSRRRTHNPDLDIDYINERNRAFNKKIERYYGKYTTEIKQNLERGTAV